MIEKIKELLGHKETRQFIRFCIVGGTCAIIDAAVFYVVRLFAPYQVLVVSASSSATSAWQTSSARKDCGEV